MNYLFIGEDEFSKDAQLQRIKQALFSPQLESFNFEILYSRDLSLKTLKTRLSALPVKARQRLILIRNAARLSQNIKEYLSTFLKQPLPHACLILDIRQVDQGDRFFSQISRSVKLINFRQSRKINAFTLARQIFSGPRQGHYNRRERAAYDAVSISAQNRIKPAIRLLRQLLLQGEKPERILGAFRYQLHQQGLDLCQRKKKLDFLLNCDIDIKKGRLKPEFALEKMIIKLCCF